MPWEAPDLFSARPDQPEYGYVAKRRRHAATREELIERVGAEKPHVDLVWTPDLPRLVPPAEVPWLLGAVRERLGRDLRHNLLNGVLLTAVWSILAYRYAVKDYPVPLLLILVLLLGVIPMVQPAVALWGLRRRPDYPRDLAATFRYQVWLGTRRMVSTWFVAACLIVVVLAQAVALALDRAHAARKSLSPALVYQSMSDIVDTADVAGLVKPAVRAGQVWRLLTCELMHGHPLHFLLNFMALLAVGRLVEVHGHAVYVPTVFLFSALCASVFSLYLSPAMISVGASGGIMGLIGFLGVIGLRRRHVLPRGFLKSIALSIALTAATGLVAYRFIDNGAHAGGLVGGALLGGVYVRHRSRETADGDTAIELAPSSMAKLAAWISAAALVAATVVTAWLLFAAVQA
jgi:membrane associated rhomboid family serine protease